MPRAATCDGSNRSPALRWTAPPAGTRALALDVVDVDAPVAGGFVHWLGWGIAPAAGGVVAGAALPREGRNSTGSIGYVGPCPPSGTHRYVFTLYALDRQLALAGGADRQTFLRLVAGHVLARAQLVGTYARGY